MGKSGKPLHFKGSAFHRVMCVRARGAAVSGARQRCALAGHSLTHLDRLPAPSTPTATTSCARVAVRCVKPPR